MVINRNSRDEPALSNMSWILLLVFVLVIGAGLYFQPEPDGDMSYEFAEYDKNPDLGAPVVLRNRWRGDTMWIINASEIADSVWGIYDTALGVAGSFGDSAMKWGEGDE